MKLVWTEEALQSLMEIDEYISRDNPTAAIEFVDKLISTAETIVDNPKKGRVVPELSLDNIRELLYKNYRIVYLVKKSSVEVLTVFEGHRLLKNEEILKTKK
jgi:addiction module RelE/StbE family toxin